MSVVAVSMVRNEADIIEQFVRINSRSFKKIFIVDHGSTDGTGEILFKLQDEGYQIEIQRHESPYFDQSSVITALARMAASDPSVDYVVPIDADEFIDVEINELVEILTDEMPLVGVGLMPWRTYVPVKEIPRGQSFVMANDFVQRSFEPEQFYKIVVPTELLADAVILDGNHAIVVNGEVVEHREISLPVKHVPIRSSEQLIAKALVGNTKMRANPNKNSVAWHWRDISKKIRENNYQISFIELQNLALRYAAKVENQQPIATKFDDDLAIGLSTDICKYENLSKQSPLAAVDNLAIELAEEIARLIKGG